MKIVITLKTGEGIKETHRHSQNKERKGVWLKPLSHCPVLLLQRWRGAFKCDSLRTFWGSAIMSERWRSFPSEAPVIHLVPQEKSKFKIYAFNVIAVLRWATELLSPEKSKIWCRNIIDPVIFSNAWYFFSFCNILIYHLNTTLTSIDFNAESFSCSHQRDDAVCESVWAMALLVHPAWRGTDAGFSVRVLITLRSLMLRWPSTRLR